MANTKTKSSGKPKRIRKYKKRDPANKKLSCPDCSRKFYFNCQLVQHSYVHTGEKPYACDICGKSFNTTYSLRTHKYIHTDEKPFKCAYCKYACRDSSTLRKHQANHIGLQTMYQCKMCDKSYKGKWMLKAHVAEAHLNVDLKKLPCDKCKKLFKTRSQLNSHIKLVHDRVKSGNCPVCNVYLTNVYNLDAHLNTHVDDRPYVCDANGCKSAFKDKSSLTKHMIKHKPDEQYPCDICGRLFTREIRLKRHIITVHGKRKHVQCDYCDVKFYSKAYLINHIAKKHVKKRKKYICDTCGLVTHNKPSIVMHLKHGHDKYNDRECKICHTVYKKHEYLKHHYRFTHKIAYKTKTRPTLIIKEEPPDDISVHSVDLFEIEKTEPDEESNPQPPEPEHPTLQTEVVCESLGDIPGDVFDQFYVETIKKIGFNDDKPKERYTSKYVSNTDKKALENSKKSKQKLLAEARKKQALQSLERARQIYNEKMKNFVNKITSVEEKKKPIKIKLFKKKQEFCSKVDQNGDDDVKKLPNDEKNELSTANKGETHVDINKTKLGNFKDIEMLSNEKNNETANLNDDNKKSDVENDEMIIDNEEETSNNNKTNRIDDNDTNKSPNDDKNDVNTNQDHSEDDKKESSTDGDVTTDDESDKEWNSKKKKKNSKINFNSHQCYICFKLYDTKEKLLDHCKDHFDVCNENCLKKCPLCPYVTKLTISRHLRMVHGVKVKIPYARIQDKKDNTDGCRYYLELNDPIIHKLEVIPSIKNLNKIASMKIDKKRREDKDKTLAKTKLVRKGKEWIVETEKINIDKDVIIPEFDNDAINNLNMKIGDSNSYFDGLKKMYHIAKKSGKTMMFPCQSCDKVCRNFSALKLHNRKHEANPKPFKKKVWKHKLKGQVPKKQPVKLQTENRTAKPKPIKNKHKCDPELKEFYENNIRGGDIEFWQFLKIFNKMSRENIKDFKDVEGKEEYRSVEGHLPEEEDTETEQATMNSITNDKLENPITPIKKVKGLKPKKLAKGQKIIKHKSGKNKLYKRVIRISKENYINRNLAKEKLRQDILQRSQNDGVTKNTVET